MKSDILIAGLERIDAEGSANVRRRYLVADGADGLLLGAQHQVWGYYVALQSGLAQVMGNTEVEGRQAHIVELRPPAGDMKGMVIRALVDQATLLPFQQTNYQVGQSGELVVDSSVYFRYGTVEELPRASIPSTVFQLNPGLQIYDSIEKLSLENARALKAYDLYYLGQQFDGFILHSIQRNRTLDTS